MKVRLGKICLTPRGQYGSSTTYERLDLVRDGANAYVSLSDGNIGHAVSDSYYWMLLVNGAYLLEYIRDHGLTASTLTVTGDGTFGGDVSVGGDLSVGGNASVTDDLTVLGNIINAALEARLADIESRISSGGGGGSSDTSGYADIAGGLTASVWAQIDAKDQAAIAAAVAQMENRFVTKTLWNTLFELRDAQGNTLSIDGDLTNLATIVSRYDFASLGGITALGTGSGGSGGGGGTTDLRAPLTLLNGIGNPSADGLYALRWRNGSYTWERTTAGDILNGALADMNGNLLNPADSGTYALTFNKTTSKYSWAAIAQGGTVTSVAMTVPTGFSVSGSPITQSGTFALRFASGYSLPTTAKQTAWDDGLTGLSTAFNRIATLEGYFSNGVANSAARLSGTAVKTIWGQTYWSNGVPQNVSGDMTNVGNMTMSGKITIGGFVIEVVDGALKFNGDIYATGGVSALGNGGSGGGVTLNEPLRSINSTFSGNPSSSGQTLVWNGSRWTYGTAGGGSGSVTRVAMTVPTGFTITGSPITSSGTLVLGFASGYRLLTSEDESIIGYGYQAYNWGKPAGTFWGNAWQNGQTLADSITINNGESVSFKDAGGTARNVVTLNGSNSFALGYGTRKAGYVTDIQGAAASTAANTATAIQFKVGLTEAGIIGMKILKDGTVHIPTSSPGLRIGDALLTWDSANNALKLSAINGTGSVNFYATGGVSALGTTN